MGLRSRPESSLFSFTRLYEFLVLNFGWLYLLFVHFPLGHFGHRLISLRDWLTLRLQLGKMRHPRKVAIIQRQVIKWHKTGAGRMMCTADETNCQKMCFSRPRYKRNCFRIKMDTLQDIIEINPSAGFVRVEPGVTVAQLMDALLPLRLTLPVVPEVGQLTIGGLILGAGVGSGSVRHGLFQHICTEFEVVTALGEVLLAKQEGEHQSLFFGIPWSLGSLGFLVSATLRTIPCPPFVKLHYQPCFSQKELAGRLQEESQSRTGNEFVEAIHFDRNNSVLISGKFVDQVPRNDRKSLNRIEQWHKPFFHQIARKVLDRGAARTEFVPSGDYFRRHWPSLFWEMDSLCPPIRLFPLRWLVRWMLPPALPVLRTRRSRRLFARQHILQNFLVPAKALPALTTLIDEQFQIYPLWICPVALPAQPGLLRNRQGLKTLYANVGIFGKSQRSCDEDDEKDIGQRLKMVEGMVREVQGFQMLCADTHQTAAEFWDMFDATLYDWLRAKYDCKGAILNVYDKVCTGNREM